MSVFKQQFLVFKQHFTYFYIFFHPFIFSQKLLNNNFQFLNKYTKRILNFLLFLVFIDQHNKLYQINTLNNVFRFQKLTLMAFWLLLAIMWDPVQCVVSSNFRPLDLSLFLASSWLKQEFCTTFSLL